MKTKLLVTLVGLFLTASINTARAQDPYIGEIRMFTGNFAPRSWLLCHGQLLPINQYSALFSILGTTYGGDGVSTFALPDLRGRVAIGEGQGPGLNQTNLGEKKGEEAVNLTVNNLPSHNHSTNSNETVVVKKESVRSVNMNTADHATVTTDEEGNNEQSTTSYTGNSQPVNNMQPSLTINYIICLEGIYPSRN